MKNLFRVSGTIMLILYFFICTEKIFANSTQLIPSPVSDTDLICQPFIQKKSVRFIYLVSADRQYKYEYRIGIQNSALSVQAFYKQQLNGRTFRLNEPIVEVVYSDKNADYFYSNPSHADKDNWGYYNAYNEVNKLIGATLFDTNYIWIIYSDGPGDKGRGGSSVSVMPEDDLLGLIGKHPIQKNIERWYGGCAHELGHALGLSHPSQTDIHPKAIMWTGLYGYYPNEAYFTEEDKQILMNSPFIFSESPIIEF